MDDVNSMFTRLDLIGKPIISRKEDVYMVSEEYSHGAETIEGLIRGKLCEDGGCEVHKTVVSLLNGAIFKPDGVFCSTYRRKVYQCKCPTTIFEFAWSQVIKMFIINSEIGLIVHTGTGLRSDEGLLVVCMVP